MTESLTREVWLARVAQLAPLIIGPMPTAQIQHVAKLKLNWLDILTVNVLAAGEGTAFISKAGGIWQLPGFKRTQRICREQPPEYALPKRACKFCTEGFVPRRRKQVFCSGNCRSAAGRKKAA